MSFVTSRLEADPRRHLRHYVNLRSRLTRGDTDLVVWTIDLSGGGARIGLDVAAEGAFEGDGWDLSVPGVGRFPVQMCWKRGSTYGLDFDISVPDREVLAGDLAQMFPVSR